MNKDDMIDLYLRKEECCGCTACFSICPVNAIVMSIDDEGFAYPVIKAERCKKCLLCIEVCPLK